MVRTDSHFLHHSQVSQTHTLHLVLRHTRFQAQLGHTRVSTRTTSSNHHRNRMLSITLRLLHKRQCQDTMTAT
jgi:hypothetical protein